MKLPVQSKSIIRNSINSFFSNKNIKPNALNSCEEACSKKYAGSPMQEAICK